MGDAPGKDVVVVGAGVAGYKSAQDLAQLGLEVLLVEARPHAGGALDQHERWFPTDDCSWCKTLPLFGGDEVPERCLRRQLDQPGIEILPAARVLRVSGERGRFAVELERAVGIVDGALCTACDICARVCPAEAADEFEDGLRTRKAAYIRHPWAVPATYSIDLASCIRCGKCEPACPTKAISFAREGKTEKRTVAAKAVILSPGFAPFDPVVLRQYRYGDHPDVYTNAGFERALYGVQSPVRRSDGAPMRRVAILHCIGSRDEDHDYCSAACCLIAVKEAIMLKERDPSIDVALFYMDMRDHARDGHAYVRRALELGVRTVRSRPSSVELGPDGSLHVVFGDEAEGVRSEAFDAVVLQVGQSPPLGLPELADACGVELDRHGFVARRAGTATETTREGVFVAGSAGGPKDVPDTVAEAAAAAMEAALVAGIREATSPPAPSCPAQGKIPATAVLVCSCHGEVAKAMDVDAVLAHAKGLPRVVHAQAVDLVCKRPGEIAQALEGKGANRLVVAACPSYQWGRAALVAAAQAGVQRDLVELVDVREWLAWANPAGEGATSKAKSVVAMASERLRTAVPRAASSVPVARPARALVVGGGLAGMTAALDIAAAGYAADIVERGAKLGGSLAAVPMTARGADAKRLLSDLEARVRATGAISVRTDTEIVSVGGAVGAFRAGLRDRKTGEVVDRVYGTVIVASGGARYKPKEYGLGTLEGVTDQFGLEDVLASGGGKAPRRVVMVQCAGSREESGLGYCSRVCCVRALRNALELRSKGAEVTILNRDIVAHGTLEELFTRARDEGVRFLRFSTADKPKVGRGPSGGLHIEVRDPGLDAVVALDADMVVLSTGMVPRPSGALHELLRTPLDAQGFMASPNAKFRGADAFRDGVYACGLCTGPKIAEESLATAHAAAARAVTVLRRVALPARVGISTVNLRSCSACGVCVSQCPFQARYLDPKDGKARVDEAACWGCGVCAQVCPNHAASMGTRSERQAMHQVDAATWT